MGNPTYVEFTHDSGQGNLYAYDQAYRLTSAQMGSADPSAEAADEDWGDYAYVQKLDFNMDDDSNRGSVVTTPYGQGSSTESYTADNLNQYTVIASVNQTHDDNGNLTDDGTCDLAYDYRNNLIQVISSSVVLSSCEFDPLGRRSKQVTGDGSYTTLYFYDGEHVVEEFDGSDDLLRKFVYGQRIDEIRVMIAPDYADVDDDSNTTEVLHFYYHTDMLGTVTHITDESENVVESYEYTPYGQTTIKDGTGTAISGSDILNPYMFTARRLDEDTGLYHYRRRAYSPERGRFLQRDPLGYVDSLCAYEYVKSQPIRFVDPTGQGLKDWAVKLFKEVASGMNIPLQVAALAEAVAPYFEANEENLDNIRDEADRRLNPELAMRRYTTQGKVIQVGLMPGVENYVKGLIVGIASWFNPTLFFADGVSKLLPPNSK
jgi:RHS repeat-associated protein